MVYTCRMHHHLPHLIWTVFIILLYFWSSLTIFIVNNFNLVNVFFVKCLIQLFCFNRSWPWPRMMIKLLKKIISLRDLPFFFQILFKFWHFFMCFDFYLVTVSFSRWWSVRLFIFTFASLFLRSKLKLLDDLMITFCDLLKFLHL